MKSLSWISRIFTVSLLLLVAAGCGSDDDVTPSNGNYIKVNGKSFDIIQASIVGVSIGGEGHAAISLSNGDQSSMKTLTLDFEYFTDQAIEGEYAYPQIETNRLLNDWLTNYATFDQNTNTTCHLQEGTLKIAHNKEDNYTITMNLIMDDGTVFSGSYTGDFIVFFNNG